MDTSPRCMRLLLGAAIVLTVAVSSAAPQKVPANSRTAANTRDRIPRLSAAEASQIINASPELQQLDRIPAQEEGRFHPASGIDAADVEGLTDYCTICGDFPPDIAPISKRFRGFRFSPDKKYAIRNLYDVISVSDLAGGRVRVSFSWQYNGRLPIVVARYTGQAGFAKPTNSWPYFEWIYDPSRSHIGEAHLRFDGKRWKILSMTFTEKGRVPFVWTDDLREKLHDYRGRTLYWSYNARCSEDELFHHNFLALSADRVPAFSSIEVWDSYLALDPDDPEVVTATKLAFRVVKDVTATVLAPTPVARECSARLRITLTNGRAYDLLGHTVWIATAKREIDRARTNWLRTNNAE